MAHVDNDFANLKMKLDHLLLPSTSELEEGEFQIVLTTTLTFSHGDYQLVRDRIWNAMMGV